MVWFGRNENKVMNLLCITFDEKVQLAPIIGAIIAATIVIIGWFIVAYFNRKNEIKKELRSFRIDMCFSAIDYQRELLDDKNFSENLYNKWKATVDKIEVFGKDSERKKLKEIIECKDDLRRFDLVLELTSLCISSLRDELKM